MWQWGGRPVLTEGDYVCTRQSNCGVYKLLLKAPNPNNAAYHTLGYIRGTPLFPGIRTSNFAYIPETIPNRDP